MTVSHWHICTNPSPKVSEPITVMVGKPDSRFFCTYPDLPHSFQEQSNDRLENCRFFYEPPLPPPGPKFEVFETPGSLMRQIISWNPQFLSRWNFHPSLPPWFPKYPKKKKKSTKNFGTLFPGGLQNRPRKSPIIDRFWGLQNRPCRDW
jgi:hypothetical protein